MLPKLSPRQRTLLQAQDPSTFLNYGDEDKEKTLGRRFADVFMNSAFYNPSSKFEYTEDKKGQAPSLEKAWEYFEHFVLPRCFENGSSYERADIGDDDDKTTLYPVWKTPLKDMADFGIGVGLYFNTLRFLAVITFIAGCINIPNMMYFNSDSYVGNNASSRDLQESGLVGSAICFNTSWELCPTCTEEDWDLFPSTDERFAWGEDANGNKIGFIKKNGCNVNRTYAIIGLVTLGFIFCAIFYWIFTQSRRIEKFNSADASCPDYSIEIVRPPKHDEEVGSSYDPECWKKWFETRTFKNGVKVEVAACTVALDNERLVDALIKRRELIDQFKEMMSDIQDFTDIDDLEKYREMCEEEVQVPFWKQVLCKAPTPASIYHDIKVQDAIIRQFSSEEYYVSSVFVTFQDKKSREIVLEDLVEPFLFQRKENHESLRFGGRPLRVRSPDEPSAIRWTSLSTPRMIKNVQNLVSTVFSLSLIAGGGFLIAYARQLGAETASLAITIINQFTPRFVTMLTNRCESHPSESSASASMYLKVTAFRWTNTVLVIAFITPFTDTLQSGDLITSVYTMFMFDLLLTPALQVLDIFGNLRRHVFGPRKKDQRSMNLSFKSSPFDLDDKYTNATKIFFLTVFHCSIFPAGFFFASAIFASAYWVDKFSILRTFSQGPKIGPNVSRISNYFFVLCLAAYAVMSGYNFAQFPFDSACETENAVADQYIGDWVVNGTDVSLEKGTNLEYEYCGQNLFYKFSFPWIPSVILKDSDAWINEAQSEFSHIFAWVMICVVFISITFLVFEVLRKTITALFVSKDFKTDDDSSEEFLDTDIDVYLPQKILPNHPFPVLLCNVDGLKYERIGWVDPYNKAEDVFNDVHNLIFDVPRVASKTKEERNLHTDDMYASKVNFVGDADEGLQTPILSQVRVWEKETDNEYPTNVQTDKSRTIQIPEDPVDDSITFVVDPVDDYNGRSFCCDTGPDLL